MKKRDLISEISKIAERTKSSWAFHRQGGNHEIWIFNSTKIPIPRHREISEKLARKIISDCEKAV